MRLRNVKNKEEIMENSNYLVRSNYKGKWHDYFKNDNPIFLEIGMGKGKFIIENAIKNPSNNYIGIEKYDSVIAKALQKIPDGLNNLCMIRADALNVDELFDYEIDTIFLNFSDPWPKKRHHFRRLSSHSFLKKYDCIFKNKKHILMRTDNRDLFTYSIVSFSSFGYKIVDISLDLHQDNMPEITTEYEDKFSKNNNSIYYIECVKD